MKCDKQSPCTNCMRFKRDCVFLAPALDSNSQQKLAELKDRVGTLEQSLSQGIARKSSQDAQAIYIKEEELDDDDDYQEFEDEKNLEPGTLSALDQVYEDDADDELMDLGVQLGKLRIADRIGGFVRPTIATEVCFSIHFVRTTPLMQSSSGTRSGRKAISMLEEIRKSQMICLLAWT